MRLSSAALLALCAVVLQAAPVRGQDGADLRPAVYELARERGWPLRELRRDVKTLEAVFNELATQAVEASDEAVDLQGGAGQ